MAKETKAEKQLREALAFMPEVVKATTASETGYLFTDFLIHSPLIEEGLVEINEGITNEDGEVATRATAKGIEYVGAIAPVTNEAVEPTKKGNITMSNFVIEEGIAMPVSKRGGKRESAYPFDALQVGQSFFIPASEKHPEPAKSLASTVSGATKRYDVEVPGETKEVTNPKTKEKKIVPKTAHTRVFQIRAADGGARVWRTA